jgi:glucose repression regulatory protein TUP1
MSMYPGHRGMGGMPPVNGPAARLNDLLDQIRAEFEAHLRQTETYEHQGKRSCPGVGVARPDCF